MFRDLTPFPAKTCTTYAGVNESAKKLLIAQSLVILFAPIVLFIILGRTLWYKHNLLNNDDIEIFIVFGVGLINMAIVLPFAIALSPLLIVWTFVMMILTLI
jgi:hypothetical protein